MNPQQEQQQRLAALNTEITELKSMLENPGWERVLDFAQGQVERRQRMVAAPLRGLEDVFTQENMKGEIAGLLLFVGAVPALIQDAEMRRADLLLAMEEGTTDVDPGRESTSPTPINGAGGGEPPIRRVRNDLDRIFD